MLLIQIIVYFIGFIFICFEKFFYTFRSVYSFEILLQFQFLLVVVDVVDRSINHMEARLHA